VIAVVGSANMDVVTQVDTLPGPGETVFARSTHHYPGGKGANQAVAAARFGEAVSFYGKVGDDTAADELLRSMAANGVNVAAVERAAGVPTGQAAVLVDGAGENAIVYTAGANSAVDAAYVDRIIDRVRAADVLLLQLEIPLAATAHLLRALPQKRPIVILDPAPPRDLAMLPLDRIDILTPNRGELASLTGHSVLENAARRLLAQGIRTVLCTVGSDGAHWYGEETQRIAAPTVAAVDTTAAGDAFNGALACVVAKMPVAEAVRWAVAAGALTTTRQGAQPSLPRRSEVEALVRQTMPPRTAGNP